MSILCGYCVINFLIHFDEGHKSFPLHRWRKWVWGWHSLLPMTQEWTPKPKPKSSLCCIPEARVAVYTEGIHCVSPPPLSSRGFCLALLPTPSLIETGPVNCYLSLLTIGVHTNFLTFNINARTNDRRNPPWLEQWRPTKPVLITRVIKEGAAGFMGA